MQCGCVILLYYSVHPQEQHFIQEATMLKTASIIAHLHLQSETMHSGSYLMRPKLM